MLYRCGADGAPAFVEVGTPSDDELHALLQTVITRLMKLLTRQGVLVEDMCQTYLAEPDTDGEEARTLRPLQAAAITDRIAFGSRAGQKVLTFRGAERGQGTVPADGPVPRERLAEAALRDVTVANPSTSDRRRTVKGRPRRRLKPLSPRRVFLNTALCDQRWDLMPGS